MNVYYTTRNLKFCYISRLVVFILIICNKQVGVGILKILYSIPLLDAIQQFE